MHMCIFEFSVGVYDCIWLQFNSIQFILRLSDPGWVFLLLIAFEWQFRLLPLISVCVKQWSQSFSLSLRVCQQHRMLGWFTCDALIRIWMKWQGLLELVGCYLGELGKTMGKPYQDSRWPCWDSNHTSSKYHSRALFLPPYLVLWQIYVDVICSAIYMT
jgi:hypothetical protein